jgi:hypothetical protein
MNHKISWLCLLVLGLGGLSEARAEGKEELAPPAAASAPAATTPAPEAALPTDVPGTSPAATPGQEGAPEAKQEGTPEANLETKETESKEGEGKACKTTKKSSKRKVRKVRKGKRSQNVKKTSFSKCTIDAALDTQNRYLQAQPNGNIVPVAVPVAVVPVSECKTGGCAQ